MNPMTHLAVSAFLFVVRANSTEAIFHVPFATYVGAQHMVCRMCSFLFGATKSNVALCLSSVQSLSFEHILSHCDLSKVLGDSSQLSAVANKAKKGPHWSKWTGIACSSEKISTEHI